MAKFPGILTDVLGASNAGPSLGFLDARYLKLDASNDPLTGELELSAGALLPNDASVFFGTDDDIGIKFNSSESRLELGLANTFIGLKENDLGFGTYELELETDIDRVVLPPDIRIEDRVGSEEPSIRLGASTPGDYLRIDYNSVDESWDVVAFGDGGLSFTSQYELSFRTTNETIAFVPAVPEVEFSPAGYSANDKHVTFYLKHYDPSGGASSADLLGVIKIDSNDNESTVDGSFLCEVFATEDHTSSAKGARAVWSLKRAGTEGPGDAAHEALELDADGLSVKDGLEVLGTTTLDTGLTGFLQATSGVVSASATIDISDDTNLATDSTLSLTGDTLGIDLSNANTWTGQQTFDAGAHFNDNDYLSFGNTSASPDARAYSDGTKLCFNTNISVPTFGFVFDRFDLTGTGFYIPTLAPLAGPGLMNFAYTLYIQDPTGGQDGFLYLPKKTFNVTTDNNLLVVRYDSLNDDALFVSSGAAIPTMTFQSQGNLRFKPMTGVIEVEANDELYLDGDTGDYKIVHNSVNSTVEVWADGALSGEFY